MHPISSVLRVRASLRSAIASARQTPAVLLAALVLCAAVLASTPAYGSSSKASADSTTNKQDIHYGTIGPDGRANISVFDSDVSGVRSDLTLTYKNLHPGVTYELTNLVLYNSKCQEITAGGWFLTSAPSHGKVTEAYVHGKLSNGACPGKIFKSRAIYYTWTHDINATKDQFKSFWAGDGRKTNTITFALKLKK